MNAAGTPTRRGRIEIVALVALGVVAGIAVAGTAYAAATVGSSSIKKNAVLSRHIKAGNVKRADIGVNAVGPAQLAASSVGTSDIANGAVSSTKLGTTVGAIAPSVLQNTGSGSPEVMELGTTIFDSANMHTSGVDSIVVTVAGMYEICVTELWAPAASLAGVREIDIRKNSTSMWSDIVAPASTQLMTSNNMCVHSALAAGDVIDVEIYQTSGAPLYSNADGRLSVMRLGAAA